MNIRSKFEIYRDFVNRYSNLKRSDTEVIPILQSILVDWEANIITKEMNNGKRK